MFCIRIINPCAVCTVPTLIPSQPAKAEPQVKVQLFGILYGRRQHAARSKEHRPDAKSDTRIERGQRIVVHGQVEPETAAFKTGRQCIGIIIAAVISLVAGKGELSGHVGIKTLEYMVVHIQL